MKEEHWIEESIKKVNRRIGEIRVERGLTQARMAEKLDLEVRYLRRFETYRNMTLRNLFRFTAALDCEINDFFIEPKNKISSPGRPRKKINK